MPEPRPNVIFVGAFKSAALDGTIGGQAYACRSLVDSPLSERIEWQLIDSTQRSQPPPGFVVRLLFAMRRFAKAIWLLITKRVAATFIFTQYEFSSFLEKGTVAIVASLLGKRSVIAIRSEVRGFGHDKYTIFFRKLVIRFCSHMIVQSEEAANQLMARLNCPREKIKIIPNWIDTQRYPVGKKSDPDKPVKFLFMGWLEVYKGVQHLIDASEELVKEGYEFEVQIGGGGSEADSLRQQAVRLNLNGTVKFLGWISGEKKDNALADADVLVLPSYSEGMPNAILEGMASGLAVIATPVGGIPALVSSEKQGVLVPVKDAASLATAMKKLIDDRNLIDSMGAFNRQTAIERHDVRSVWPIVADVLGVLAPSDPNTAEGVA